MPATLHVHTFKDGLLARLAHDLRLHVGRFDVALDGGTVRASFDPASARVDGVMHGDRLDAAGLSDKDKRTVEETIHTMIVRGPVSFEGEVAGDRVRGRLTMNGQVRDLDLPVRVAKGELVVDTEIVPSRWGIAPYKALAGAIRLQDRWRVRLTLPVPAGDPRPAGPARWP